MGAVLLDWPQGVRKSVVVRTHVRADVKYLKARMKAGPAAGRHPSLLSPVTGSTRPWGSVSDCHLVVEI